MASSADVAAFSIDVPFIDVAVVPFASVVLILI
jgi:hypothetical protein